MIEVIVRINEKLLYRERIFMGLHKSVSKHFKRSLFDIVNVLYENNAIRCHILQITVK